MGSPLSYCSFAWPTTGSGSRAPNWSSHLGLWFLFTCPLNVPWFNFSKLGSRREHPKTQPTKRMGCNVQVNIKSLCCLTLVNFPLANANHMAKLRVSVGRDCTGPWSKKIQGSLETTVIWNLHFSMCNCFVPLYF